MIDGFELDPAWPRMTLAEVDAALTAPGARFEMEQATIRGVPTRVWKYAPPSLPMLARFSRMHGERLITIFEEERISFEASFRASAACTWTFAAVPKKSIRIGRPAAQSKA